MKNFISGVFTVRFAFLLIFLILSSYIFNGFTWLDHNDIELKQAILPLDQIYRAVLIPFGTTAFYRPLVTFLYSTDLFFWGEYAPGFHLTNILLHLAVAFIAIQFIQQFITLSKKEKISLALIIGIHPAASIVIGSIAHRQESMVALFIMLTVIFHVKFRKKPSYISGVLLAFSYLAALFSKETAFVVIPLLIIFWEFLLHQQNMSTKTSKKKSRGIFLKIFIIEICIIVLYLLLRFRSVSAVWGTKPLGLPLDQEIGVRLYFLFRIIINLISPLKPAFSDAVRIISVIHPISILMVLFVSFLLFFIVRKGIYSKFSILTMIFIILAAPGLNFIPVPRPGALHYAYLPLIPFAAAFSIITWNQKLRVKHAGIIIFIVWMVISASTSFKSGFRFSDDETLFLPEVRRDEHFLEGYQYLGDYYFYKEDFKKAEHHYMRALNRNENIIAFSDTKSVLNNFAGVRLRQNRLIEADQLLSKITNPSPIVRYNRALIARERGDHKKVVDLLMKHVFLFKEPEPYLLLAESLKELGRTDEMNTVLQQAVNYVSDDHKDSFRQYMNTIK